MRGRGEGADGRLSLQRVRSLRAAMCHNGQDRLLARKKQHSHTALVPMYVSTSTCHR